jgi:hypothetical protein
MKMERFSRGAVVADSIPSAAHRRVIAGRLYAQAAKLLLAAERAAAGDVADAQPPAALLRATAARLEQLAARLEAPVPAVAPAPVALPVARRHPRRSA